jgi:methylated-DNA-[protein]-cysteine S-methyltransferase
LWNERGLLGLQLPEANERKTSARLLREFPEASEAEPSAEIKEAVANVTALLNGEASDLSNITLDMGHVPPFHRRVYELARGIPAGATLSYGEIAHRLGMPGAARAVGQALGRNPFPIVVPCHRVLAANGKLGGFSANGGVATKMRLLTIEGARISNQLALFDGDGALSFDPAVAIEQLRAADPVFGELIDAVGPFRMQITRTNTLFLALARAIVYQQLTGKAAATIFARLRALFPHAHDSPTAEQILRASEEKLLSAGLSRSKLLSLKDLARKTVDGVVPKLAEVNGMENEEIIERLTQVRGHRPLERRDVADFSPGPGRTYCRWMIWACAKDLRSRSRRGSCRRGNSSKNMVSGGSLIEAWRAGICGGWRKETRCNRREACTPIQFSQESRLRLRPRRRLERSRRHAIDRRRSSEASYWSRFYRHAFW